MMGDEIKERRRARRLSQIELGNALGISQGRMSQLESGDRKLTREEAEKLHAFFENTPPVLLAPITIEEVDEEMETLFLSIGEKGISVKVSGRDQTDILQRIDYALKEIARRKPAP